MQAGHGGTYPMYCCKYRLHKPRTGLLRGSAGGAGHGGGGGGGAGPAAGGGAAGVGPGAAGPPDRAFEAEMVAYRKNLPARLCQSVYCVWHLLFCYLHAVTGNAMPC